MSDDREVVESHQFTPIPSGEDGWIAADGARVSPQFLAFVQQAIYGKLPDPGEVPEMDPEIVALAEELACIHLPEWRNPAGRQLAEPTVTGIKQAVRVAEYLHKRGIRRHPDLEQIRWVPTPGGMVGPFDTGLHITPDENGQWPTPDPEEFWDIEDIKVTQLQNGTWAAAHPRGIALEADTKSEAYAGLVDKIRAKIEEAKQP